MTDNKKGSSPRNWDLISYILFVASILCLLNWKGLERVISPPESNFSQIDYIPVNPIPTPQSTLSSTMAMNLYQQLGGFFLRQGNNASILEDETFFNIILEHYTYYSTRSKIIKRGFSKNKVWRDVLKGLHQQQVPKEFASVIWVESRFLTKAESHAGAVGLWQLMPQTARGMGLTVSWKKGGIDERTHPYRSTVGATKYLKYLISLFDVDAFPFALAAYNAGPTRVLRNIQEFREEYGRYPRYYEVQEAFPRETELYVPKVLAALAVGLQNKLF